MPFPPAAHLQELLDRCRPVSVLRELQGDVPVELLIYKAQAFLYLDQMEEASGLLEKAIQHLHGNELARAKRYWSQILLHKNQLDEAIFTAQSAVQAAESDDQRAYAMIEQASGYSRKLCRPLTEKTLQAAKTLVGPIDPMILLAEAHLLLDADERLAARDKYARLSECDYTPWAQFYASWGRSIVAFLLGDFKDARTWADACLQISDEMVWPYFLLANLSVIEEDAERLEQVIQQLTAISPNAGTLPSFQSMLELLRKREQATGARGCRLKAFPTTMQKRDYCGPSTIDLVLRFWKSSQEFTDDQIATFVKLPHGGTPINRMQEFFHLVGFDTIRCRVSIPDLKRLIDAGYPVIVEEELPDNAHVSVVIGYDEASHVIEFQDPMTHQVVALPEDLVDRLRKTYLDSALIAFPQGQGHEMELARLGFFDEPAMIWTDQAGLALDRGQYQEAAFLVERAAQRLPNYQLAWMLWLSALQQGWQSAQRRPGDRFFGRLKKGNEDPAQSRKRFFEVLQRARELFPESKFVHAFSGQGALQEGNAPKALDAFKRASEIDPDDSRGFASMSACHFSLRETQQAFDMAREALKRNPTLPAANVWMARCLAARMDATAEHYVRCALDLAPTWWLAHQALGEVHQAKQDFQSARHEFELAAAMDPDQREPRIQRALLVVSAGFPDIGAPELEKILKYPDGLPLYAEYNARQALCRIAFGRRKFDQAQKEVSRLLKRSPQDPWALQFVAAAKSEELHQKRADPVRAARQIRELYELAIPANDGTTWVISDFLRYLSWFVAIGPLLVEIGNLRQKYPESHGLLSLHAHWLKFAGRQDEAAKLMLEAIRTPNEIVDPDDVYRAVQVVISGMDVQAADAELLSLPELDGVPPLIDRQRALGLALAASPKEHGVRAGDLLRLALDHRPDDAHVMLRLGDLATEPREREDLYRRALQAAPGWSYIRAYVANHLTDTGRAREALSFTEGHRNESLDILVASGRAFYSLGRYEEATFAYRSAVTGMERPDSWLLENLWYAEDQSGDHSAALGTSRQGMHLFPQEVKWYVLGARSLRNQGKFFQASRTIQQGMNAKLGYVAHLESEYENALGRGQYRAALRAEEKLSKWEQSTGEKYLTRSEERRLRVLLKLGRRTEAREIVDTKPWFKSAEAWRGPIRICLETSSWELAGDLAERALACDAQDFTGMFARAQVLAETGHPDQAISAFEQACNAHPYEHEPYEKLAVHLAVTGQLEDAMQMAERAVLLGPSCPFSWATRGYLHFLNHQGQSARSDLEMGWKKATYSQRQEQRVFWWILASLQTRPFLGLYRQLQSRKEAHTAWQKSLISQTGKLVNRTYVDRIRRILKLA